MKYRALLFGAVSLLLVRDVYAAGHAKPNATVPLSAGKRVVELVPVAPVSIEMPDDGRANWGQDLDGAVVRQLEDSGRFIVVTPQERAQGVVAAGAAQNAAGGFHWIASTLPAASVRFKITQMSFLTGDRGARAFYGFNDRIPNLPNDFPLRDTLLEPNWMDRTFDAVGVVPMDSQSGLDLGDGFGFNAIIAGIRARYARYEARLGVEVTIEHLAGGSEVHQVEANTDGFFVDVAGGYMGYSGGIRIARKDAMVRAMEQVAQGVAQFLEKTLSTLPLTAQVDAILPTGEWLIGTGMGARVPVGVQYRAIARPECVLRVVATVEEGVVATAEPACASLTVGAQLIESAVGVDVLGMRLTTEQKLFSDQIYVPGQKMQAADGLAQSLGAFDPMDIAKFFALPYRIYRYFQYDRPLAAQADQKAWAPEWRNTVEAREWPKLQRPAWAKGTRYLGQGVTIALLDSGVDYNHPALFGRIAGIHPNRDVGFDPISGDDRAYDDGYHGTEVASAILSVAPDARVLPIKVFNPWGVTRTGALVAAVQYAADSGAEILVLPWATRRASRALRDALQVASDLGVVIVTAAGDRGEDLEKTPTYPAAWQSEMNGALVTVGGINSAGTGLTGVLGRKSNFSSTLVQIAAPGENIRAARPRADWAQVTHTGVATGAVAGAIARELQWGRERGMHGIRAARDRVLESAQRLPALEGKVAGARSLRLRPELLE